MERAVSASARCPMEGFRWQVPGKLAGMAHPSWMDQSEEAVIAFLKREGVGAIVSLTERPLPPGFLTAGGFEYLHLPVPDMEPPTQRQIAEFVGYVNRQVQQGKPVAAHCLAGRGRTGTMLACYLVSDGLSARQALAEVRSKLSASVETSEQEEAVYEYAARVRP